jgi:hypothetical protein
MSGHLLLFFMYSNQIPIYYHARRSQRHMYRLDLQIEHVNGRRVYLGRRRWRRCWFARRRRRSRTASTTCRDGVRTGRRSRVALRCIILVVLCHLTRLPFLELRRINIITIGSPVNRSIGVTGVMHGMKHVPIRRIGVQIGRCWCSSRGTGASCSPIGWWGRWLFTGRRRWRRR